MSKTDFSRDYYADLELPPTADISDIKKQFRKLALKYHPDRNPGKETEVNAKFQTIQAAHEILSNPDQKIRYDAHRNRKPPSRFPTGSGVRGNPWQDVAEQYPTPPRRPGQPPASAFRGYGTSSTPRNPPPASAGSSAHRYSTFNQPPTAKTNRDSGETHYQAWKNMRPSAKPPKTGQSASAAYAGADSRAHGFGSRPAPTAASNPSASSSMPPPPPRTTSQKQKADASFGSRRPTGFFPRSPMGDEPPAPNTGNYFTGRNHSSTYEERAARQGGQSGRTTPTRSQRKEDARSADTSEDAYFDTRQSTPYQTHGGEKFNPFDGVPFPDLSRARSQRAPMAQDKPSSRRRSSSLPDESDGTGRADATGSAWNTAETPGRNTAGTSGTGSGAGTRAGVRTRTGPALRHKFSTPSTPMPQFDMHYRMRKEEDEPPTTPIPKAARENQHETPADTPGRTPASATDGPILYAAPHPEHPKPHPPSASFTPIKISPPARVAGGKSARVQQQTIPPEGTPIASEFEKPSPGLRAPHSRAFPSGDADRHQHSTGISVFESKQFEILEKLVRKVEIFDPHAHSSKASEKQEHDAQHKRRRRQRLPDGLSLSSISHADPIAYSSSKFSFDGETSGPTSPMTPSQAPRHTGRFMSSSAEGINTRFVAEEQANAAWKFSAGGSDSGSGDYISSRTRRSQSGSRIGRQSQSPGKEFTVPGAGSVPSPSQAPPQTPPRPPRPLFTATETQETQPSAGVEETAGFNPEKWTEKIGLEHFAPQVPPRKATPTQFSMRPNKKPRPVRSATRAFVVDESDDSTTAGSETEQDKPSQPTEAPDGESGNGEFGNGERFSSPVAMDIDSPGPTALPEQTGSPKESTTSQADDLANDLANGSVNSLASPGKAQATGVRNIPVEPSRPEWRAGDIKKAGVDAAANGTTIGGSEDSEEFLSSLADMKKVEPFADAKVGAPGSGLGSLNDLRINLPFESKSSAKLPIKKVDRKKTITFPKAPTAPHPPPALAVPGLQPSSVAWESYVVEFRHYMQAWAEFNNLYVDHFLARRNAIEKQRREGNFAWLTTMGDDGIAEYLAWMDQDSKIRSVWSESCTEHERVVRQFMTFRDRMK